MGMPGTGKKWRASQIFQKQLSVSEAEVVEIIGIESVQNIKVSHQRCEVGWSTMFNCIFHVTSENNMTFIQITKCD